MAGALSSAIRSRSTQVIFLIGLVALVFLPLQGPGVPLCGFKYVTGLPCPGCGLTRSLIHLAHGQVAGAARFHPGGLILFPLILCLPFFLFTPEPGREAAARWVEVHGRAINIACMVALALFVIYGFGRLAWLLVSKQPSIW